VLRLLPGRKVLRPRVAHVLRGVGEELRGEAFRSVRELVAAAVLLNPAAKE
jgi:hypothetical protein